MDPKGLTCPAVVLVLLGALDARGQVVIDGIQFADQGAAGVIDLGYQRGGLSVLDCTGDGFPDLVIGDRANRVNQLFLNVPDPMRPGNRTFVDATDGSGLDDAEGVARISRGVVAADYDNDGHVDVFMAGYLPGDGSFGLLYRGHGDGTFTNVSISSGVRAATGCNADAVSWTDYDLDGDLDLLIGCGDAAVAFELIENDGDGTFTFVSDRLPPPTASVGTYAMRWLDVDGDGYDDCFTLARPAGQEVLLLNAPGPEGGRVFVNAATTYGFTNLGPAPMGIAAGDYDGDGDLDLAVSTAGAGSYYRFDAGTYTAVPLVPSIFGWGVSWIDVENDGDLDLIMCGSAGQGSNFDKLFRNNGVDGFDDVSTALNGIEAASRYAVQVDFNNDGRQDVITCNTGSPDESLTIYENLTEAPHHWLKVGLVGAGTAVNRDAVGAVVRLQAAGTEYLRHLASGSSTTATEDTRLHFGLGPVATVDRIEVVWPRPGSPASRTEAYCGPIAADRIVTLVAGDTAVPGDANGDGVADVADFLALLAAWGACPAPPQACPADLDGDCAVGVTDFLVLLANWS